MQLMTGLLLVVVAVVLTLGIATDIELEKTCTTDAATNTVTCVTEVNLSD